MNQSGSTDGFIMMEAIVTFAILSLSLVALYEAVGFAYRAQARTDIVRSALIIGESQLALAGITPHSATASWSDVTHSSFQWHISISPLPLASSHPPSPGLLPHKITFTAKNPTGAEILRLETVKLLHQSDPSP